MKKILTLVVVSALGGIITLGAYKLFLEENKSMVLTTSEIQTAFVTTNNTSNLKSMLKILLKNLLFKEHD